MIKKVGLLFVVVALLLIAAAPSTHPAQAAQEQTITVWGFVWTADWLDSIKPGFEAAHPGVTVNIERFEYDPYRDAVVTALAAGENAPDVVTLDPMWAGDLIRNGAVVALDGIENELNPADFTGGGWELCGYAGKQYGVPADLDFNVVFYRKDIYDPAIKAAGLDGFPANTADFVKVAQAITKDKQYAILLGVNDYYGFYQGFLTPYNGRLVSEDGSTYLYNNEAAVAALTLYNDLANTYKVARLWDDASDGDQAAALKNGEVLAVMRGSWYATELAAVAPELEGKWGVAPMPFGPEDRKYDASTGGACFSIPKASKAQDLARQFLVYMEQPEVMATYYEKVGGVPALQTAWQHIDLSQDNEYLGVPLAKLISEWAVQVRGMELPSAEVAEHLGEAIYIVTKEGGDVKESLDNAVASSPALK